MNGQGKLIVFTGSTPNIGTTVVAFGTAVLLAQLSGEPVGYICLNLKSSKLHHYVGLEPCPPGVDQIRAEMRSGGLTPGFLKSRMVQVKGAPGVHVLFGSLQREQAEFFQPEDIGHLLDIATQSFSRCVVEVNAYWDNAATLAALMQADERILVTSTELGHFQEDVNRVLKQMAPLFGMSPEGFLLAVTQHNRSDGLTPQDAAKETGMRLAAVMKADPELRRLLGQGRLAEYIGGNDGFTQALIPLCGELGVSPKEPASAEGIWALLRRQSRLFLGGRTPRRNQ